MDNQYPLIISCGSAKIDTNALPTGTIEAEKLYTGSLFKICLKTAKTLSTQVYILSAHYGILQLNDQVSTYERKMDLKRKNQYLKELKLPQSTHIYAMLPKMYLASVPIAISLMIPGLRIGEFMSYAKKLKQDITFKQSYPRQPIYAQPIK
jgi:hypothetical protein